MYSPDSYFHDVGQVILDGVSDDLAGTVNGRPDRVCMYPGQIAWDVCDCKGMLAGSLERMYPSERFPDMRTIENVCDPPYLVGEFVFTVLRCAPMPDDKGNPPTCEALTAASRVLAVDATALWRGVACTADALKDAMTIDAFMIRVSETAGPAGGCVGSVLRVAVGVIP